MHRLFTLAAGIALAIVLAPLTAGVQGTKGGLK